MFCQIVHSQYLWFDKVYFSFKNISMKTHKHTVKNFSSKMIDVVEGMIADFDIEGAQRVIKRLLLKTNYDSKAKSDFYVLLGRIKYSIGHLAAAKRYYKLALRFDPKNYNAFYHMTHVHMYEQDIQGAKKLVGINLKENPGNVGVLIQHIWCILFESGFEDAKAIYQQLVNERKIRPQGFVDIAMGCLSKGDFSNSKKVIGTALSFYPESYILEDAYWDIVESEENFKEYRTEIFFKRLDKIHFMTDIYSSALRLFVDGTALRGYMRPDVESGADFILFLNEKQYEIDNPCLLASAVEFSMARSIGDERYIRNILINRYKLTNRKLRNVVDEIKEIGLIYDFDLAEKVTENMLTYGGDFNDSEEDFEDE